MSSKHFIHDPTNLVTTALRSITLTNPSVAFDAENKIVYRRPGHEPQVSIVSGGGSGHEPSFAAFVGEGLLAGAVAGTIFASPSAEQVRRCILKRVEKERGVLVVVMNYTGDILNFGMAVEKAKAGGLNVEMVVVGDDAGVGRKQGGKVGRRGIAGTVLVLKVAGALAAQGASLKEVHHIAKLTAENVVSIGSSLAHVHVPGRGEAKDDLKADEVEIGMGIHNEPGSERKKEELPDLVKTMLSHMLDSSDADRGFLRVSPKDETVLLVNNLGGVSVLELGGITNEAVEQLERDWKIKPVRIIAGTFMTSLNGLGFSLSLLKIKDTGLGSGKSMLELLDTPAEATGWSAAIKTKTWENKSTATRESEAGDDEESKPSNLQSRKPARKAYKKALNLNPLTPGLLVDPVLAKKALLSGLKRLIDAEPDVTNYDTIVGDGDCGIGLKRGAEAIMKLLERHPKQPDDVEVFLQHIIQSVETNMDGTSGAIYAIFLNALANGLRQQAPSSPKPITPEVWSKALESSLEALSKYTPARPGDRTLVDALYPFVGTLTKTGDIKSAAQAAEAGAKGTKGMKASLGRTVYVGGEGWQGVPDPGAHGLAQFLLGLSEEL